MEAWPLFPELTLGRGLVCLQCRGSTVLGKAGGEGHLVRDCGGWEHTDCGGHLWCPCHLRLDAPRLFPQLCFQLNPGDGRRATMLAQKRQWLQFQECWELVDTMLVLEILQDGSIYTVEIGDAT